MALHVLQSFRHEPIDLRHQLGVTGSSQPVDLNVDVSDVLAPRVLTHRQAEEVRLGDDPHRAAPIDHEDARHTLRRHTPCRDARGGSERNSDRR